MMIEIIDENKYYSHFIGLINKLDIKPESILLLSVDDDSITLFIEDDISEFNHNKIIKISEYFKLIYSTRCGLIHENINYYDLYSYKYEISIDNIRDIKLDELGI
jgi:hypothetical protein